MTKPIIRQFKLSTGEEIICEVLEWDNEENSTVLIRSALKIVESENYKSGIKVFSFKPFMFFGDDPRIMQTINSEHVVGELSPCISLLKMYAKCILKIAKEYDNNQEPPTIDLEDLDHLDNEELEAYLETELSKIKHGLELIEDSGTVDNIIQFKPKETVH